VNRQKFLLLSVVLTVLVVAIFSASVASAAAAIPVPHPPRCRVVVEPKLYYQVNCSDVGKDIVNAAFYSTGTPVQHSLKWNNEQMVLTVYFNSQQNESYRFNWMVSDRAGNVVRGSFPGPISES
jgi:hypothetical protein